MNDVTRREKRSERLQVMLLETELKIIDEWRFENRIPSRAAAIRELLRRGLLASGIQPEQLLENAGNTDQARPSEAFGLLEKES